MNNAENDSAVMSAETPAVAALSEISSTGHPLTRQRRALVAFIMSHTKPFTAEALISELRDEGIRVGRATVFRTVELLTDLGYVHRQANSDRVLYIACSPRHHHHLLCSNCGQVVHFEDCPIDALLSELESRTGYQIERHSLELGGLCPSCQR